MCLEVLWRDCPPADAKGGSALEPKENALLREWLAMEMEPEAGKSGDGESSGDSGGDMDWHVPWSAVKRVNAVGDRWTDCYHWADRKRVP